MLCRSVKDYSLLSRENMMQRSVAGEVLELHAYGRITLPAWGYAALEAKFGSLLLQLPRIDNDASSNTNEQQTFDDSEYFQLRGNVFVSLRETVWQLSIYWDKDELSELELVSAIETIWRNQACNHIFLTLVGEELVNYPDLESLDRVSKSHLMKTGCSFFRLEKDSGIIGYVGKRLEKWRDQLLATDLS